MKPSVKRVSRTVSQTTTAMYRHKATTWLVAGEKAGTFGTVRHATVTAAKRAMDNFNACGVMP